jgi:hypothetical protein
MKKILSKKYLELLAGILLLFGGVGFGVVYALPASAAPGDVFTQGACSSNTICKTTSTSRIYGVLNTVVTVLLWASGIISVIMIIVGGIMYSVAAGDPGKISKAKDTVLYAVVGLVVSILAYTIVNFVLTKI